MTGADMDRTEVLFRLQQEIARRRAAGLALTAAELAAAFALPLEEVERSLAGVAALAALELPRDEAPPPLTPPQLPADYDLMGEVGRGGMGVVYKARQRSLDRVVAVKVLRPGDLLLGDVIQRFRKEARSLARLRHPHIVSIHEVGDAAGLLYFTMDFIEGAPLSELIRSGDMTPTRAVHLLRQVASAVAYSHAQGVVHRDLKPANILVDGRGHAFVADFGLARDAAATDRTATGQILGTPAYMSPEQARGDASRIGERSDVYALGAILYECLTGRAPFAGLGLAELVHAVLHDEPRAPRRLRPEVPRDLELICRKAMAKEPEQRYATANALLEDLERFHDGRPVRARPPSLVYRGTRLLRRHWPALLLGSGVAALLVVGFVAVVLPLVRPPAAATLAAAVALAERGEHRAALVLLDKARGEVGAQDRFDELRRRAVTSQVALVRAALAGGADQLAAAVAALNQAADDATAMRADDARGVVVETAWELAARACVLEEDAAVDAATAVVDRVLAVRRLAAHDGMPDLGFLLALGLGHGSGHAGDLLARLIPALVDGRDVLHSVAARFVVRQLSDATRRPEIVAWLRTQAERDPRLLASLLARLDQLTASRREAIVRLLSVRDADGELAQLVRSSQAHALLAGLAADGTTGPVARAVAADLLAAVTDLPLRMPRSKDGALLPRGDDAAVAAILALWREVKDLDRSAGWERRMAAAIASPDLGQRGVRAWLDAHTLAAPGAERDFGTADAWQQWWKRARPRDPRAQLGQALGFAQTPGEADLPAVLDRFLVASGRERSALHHLLVLLAPERADRPLPIRPWPEHESPALPMQWWHVVHGDAVAPTWHVRAASIAWRDGAPGPELLWEEQRLVRLDEVVRLGRVGPLAPLPLACGTPRVPGFDIAAAAASGRCTEQLPPLVVRWTPRRRIELCPVGGDAQWSAQDVLVGNHSASSDVPDMAAGVVTVALRASVPAWADGGRGGERFLCVTLQAGTAEPAPWGLTGWQAAVAAHLRQLPVDFWRAAPPAQGCNFSRVQDAANGIALAALIPVPQARADLERLTMVIPQHQPPGSDEFSRRVTRARLLLGDPKPLGSPQLTSQMPVVEEKDFDAERETRYWARVLLAAGDPALQAVAAQRLHAVHLSPEWAVGIAAGGDAVRANLPAAVRERLAPVRLWQDRLPDHLDVVLPSLAALLVLVLVVARMGLCLARRRGPTRGDGALLCAAGALVVLFDVAVAGIPLLPDALGCALCAAGAWLLAGQARHTLRWPLVALFLLAAATDLLARLGLAPLHLQIIAVTLVAVALPLLLVRPRAWPWQLLVVASVAVFLWGVAPSLWDEWRARLLAGMPAWSFWGGPAWNWSRQALPLSGVGLVLVHLLVGAVPRRVARPVPRAQA